MTEITRDVILDLLPLYVAGEVSQDTSVLVEEYLQTDPQLAKIAEQSKMLGRLVDDVPPPTNREAEMETYEETRRVQNQRTLMWAVVIAIIILAGLGLVTLAVFFLSSA